MGPEILSWETSLGEQHGEVRASGTLRPPEMKVARRKPSSGPPAEVQPLVRREGVRAEEAWLRARVEEARASGDMAALRATSTTLARWLASRDRDLDEAIELATTALSLGADGDLRLEVSAWLESVGEPARAAAALRPIALAPVEVSENVYLLVRAGVLKARAGAASAAAEAFEEASALDPRDPVPTELLGALSSWDPASVRPPKAAAAYVEAARRRRAQDEGEAQFEDLWRAITMDVSSEVAARSLASALEQRGQPGAADEVLRGLANEWSRIDPRRAASIHSERLASALASSQPSRALGALLDCAADSPLEPSEIDIFDAHARALQIPDPDRLRLELGETGRETAVMLEVRAAHAVDWQRATLLAVASERYLRWGDRTAARRAAVAAVAVAAEEPRCAAALANAVMGDCETAAVAALEHAIAVVGPRIEWSGSIADSLYVLGRRDRSLAWTQRCVALRPGDPGNVAKLLERLVDSTQAAPLADALAWLLSQPLPLEAIAPSFGSALLELSRFDRDRAAVVARRTLDVFGPRLSVLRNAMLQVAGRASDDAFTAAIFERWLACAAHGAERRWLLAQLTGLFERMGDVEAEARVVARTAREGLGSPDIDAHLEHLVKHAASPDAELWRMSALACRSLDAGPSEGTVAVWRKLGAALWDLAEDRVGAIAAWQRAARLSPSEGYTVLTLDLIEFGGAAFAFEYMQRLIDAEPDDAAAAEIAGDAALAALMSGDPSAALELSGRSIARFPRDGSALEIAEPAAQQSGHYEALSPLYDTVAAHTFGRFGRRAAHYRGARFFERAAQHALALRHAARAFRVLPSEGSGLQLLVRCADRAGDHVGAMRTIELVAEEATAPEARTGWLLRAASVAGQGEDGARRRIDVLLRALAMRPTANVIALLRDAASALMRLDPEEREALQMRFSRAIRGAGDRLSGPQGANVAIAFAAVALELFEDPNLGFSCVERAYACDGDVDEFTDLVRHGPLLARADGAADRLSAMLAAAEQPHSNTGPAALRLLATVSAELGDDSLRARVALAVALRNPDDDAAVLAADEAVRRQPQCAERLATRVSLERRASAILALARAHFDKAEFPEAVSLFERALTMVDENARGDVERELGAAWRGSGRELDIEQRVRREADDGIVSPRERAARWMDIAERREARLDPKGALDAVLEACKLDPEPLERWSALERIAVLAEDSEAQVRALEEIARRVGNAGRLAVFKRAARAYERNGDVSRAERTWQEVLGRDPTDEEANRALESMLAQAGRYEDLAEHLASRAERLRSDPGRSETLCAVRLRRAAILEQRLDRVEDACAELQRLLEEVSDSPGARRYLADLLDRKGDPESSAPLWLASARAALDPLERDELEIRACRALLAAGHHHDALDLSQRILQRGLFDARVALELRVAAARAIDDAAELGEALAALAMAKEQDEEVRSLLLLEAAMIAARMGDLDGALQRARGAAEASPERATPQLLARGLEYRFRGAGAPDDARQTIAQLGAIRDPLARDDVALRGFLLAEALDVVQGGGAGLQELKKIEAVLGAHPLVALGLAERLSAQGNCTTSVDAFRIALSGSLFDLRKPGMVALSAADNAIRAGRIPDAMWFLEIAERDSDARAAAQEKRALLLSPSS